MMIIIIYYYNCISTVKPCYLTPRYLASRHMNAKDGFPAMYFKSPASPLALAMTCASLALRNLISVRRHCRPVSGDLDSSAHVCVNRRVVRTV